MSIIKNSSPTRADEVRITFRMPTDVAEGMRTSAKMNDRSLNGEIVRALREYLAQQSAAQQSAAQQSAAQQSAAQQSASQQKKGKS